MLQQMDKMVACKCKQCLKTVTFTISEEKIKVGPYPITLSDTHGTPPHKLKVFVNKRLEIESFEIEEVQEQEQRKVSTHILGQVLGDIGLTPKETELYFHCTSLGPVSPGEMSILVSLPIDAVKEIAQKFVAKGLFKEIAGATQYYQALPPYAALLSQLDKFSGFITNIKDDTPRQLQRSFSSFEQQAKGVQNLKEFVTYLTQIKARVSQQLVDQKNTLQLSLGRLIQQRDSLQHELGNIQDKISRNLDKLRLGVILQTVQDIISKIIAQEAEVMQQTSRKPCGTFLRQLAGSLIRP
jgi:sugar-specific transcriptional regulator TrmB